MSYNSKYTGQEVEELLDQVKNGGTGGGGITSESDPIYSASPAAKITDSDISEWNNKQETITDLDVIREGASKGATALQSYTEQYKGTVTGVKMNGTTKNPSSGVVDLGTVITEHQDISGKQDKLVSGTTIKTINGESILGEGDIVIEGGSDGGDYLPLTGGIIKGNLIVENNFSASKATVNGIYNSSGASLRVGTDGSISTADQNSDSALNILTNGDGTKFLANDGSYKTIEAGSSAYPTVNHGTSDTTYTLTPNTYHVWGIVTSLNLSFGAEESGVVNEYVFQFDSGSTATTLSLPASVEWVNGTPTIEANMTYQVSIVNNIGLIVGV